MSSDSTPDVDPSPTPRNKSRWRVPAALACLLVIAAAGWWLIQWRATSGRDIPLPDLATANVRVATAASQLREQVRQQPRSAEAWGNYASMLMAHEWNDEALECFKKANQLDPRDMRWPYLVAILLERRQPTEAIDWYEKARQLDANYAPLYVRMSKLQVRLNRVEEAEAALHTASELAKNEPYPLIGLARIAASRNDWKTAARLLEQAVTLAPSNREAVVELTRAKLMLGTARALSREEQVALLSGKKYEDMPDPVMHSVDEREVAARFAAMQADQTAAQGDMRLAASRYAELVKQRPDLSRPRLNLASAYMAQGQLVEGVATLREVVRLFPDEAMGHYALGVALEASNELDEARREQETAVRLKPDYAEAHFALGLLEERQGNAEQAIEEYRRAVQSDPSLARAHLALGVALHQQRRWDEGLVEMKAAVQLSPGDPVPQSFLQKALSEKAAREAAPK